MKLVFGARLPQRTATLY